MWIFYVLFYGLIKGARDIIKKIAMRQNSIIEILVAHTGLSLLFVIPTASDALYIDRSYLGYIALKALFVFTAWICSFKAISRLPVSIVGILDLSRVIFATLLGVIVLGEVMQIGQYLGLFLVCAGLLMLKFINSSGKSGEGREDVRTVFVLLALASCILNASSGLLDKILMSHITSSQLQLWFLLFMFIDYLLYAIITRSGISLSVLKNYWVWILSIIFVLADRALFIANASPDSKITLMTLIKQSCCIVTIIGGKLVFGEKNIAKKMICACIIIAGIMIGILL